MVRRRWVLVVAMFGMFCGFANSAGPTTRPAGDQATPKGTVKLFTASVQSADVEKVKTCLHAATETERKYAQGYADITIGVGKMRTAMVTKFGDAASRQFNMDSESEQLKRIDEATEKVNGDAATVEVAGKQPTRVELVRVDGYWKIAIAKLIAGKKPAQVQAELTRMQVMSTCANDTANEVLADRYKSLEVALSAFQAKVRVAVAQVK